MKDLEKIIGKYANDYTPLLLDIEVYVSKKLSISYLEENDEYVRIFPKNGSHYIDIIPDYGIDDRIYIAIRRLYDNGLTNYISKISFHEGTLRMVVQKIYTIKEVEIEFNKHLNGSLNNIFGDNWNYEFSDDL